MGRPGDRGSAAEARLRARRELAEARAQEDPAVRHVCVCVPSAFCREIDTRSLARALFLSLHPYVPQNAFWREIACPMGGGEAGRAGPLRPITTFAECEHREHVTVRSHPLSLAVCARARVRLAVSPSTHP
jgi:hypothetical protein|eukprot:COSAG03_NODE_1266_length_4438_cov_8.476838_3_plen_131_part_00